MRRREFITLLGGAAAAWAVTARAQGRDRRPRVAVVMHVEGDSQGQVRAVVFREGLEKAGWMDGRYVSVDYLWGVLDSECPISSYSAITWAPSRKPKVYGTHHRYDGCGLPTGKGAMS
jgi:hypothetical protein